MDKARFPNRSRYKPRIPLPLGSAYFCATCRLYLAIHLDIISLYLIVVFALYMKVCYTEANNYIPPLILGVRTIG